MKNRIIFIYAAYDCLLSIEEYESPTRLWQI